MSPSRHGLLLVDKPAGPTSHEIVKTARRALSERRIGHTGTLDPAATGLLVLCVGAATRLQQYMLGWRKTYVGEIRLGFATTTYDTEGEMIGEPAPVPALDAGRLAALEARFSGELLQVPPAYSAKKVAGRKAYDMARAGEQVQLEPTAVTIYELTLTLAHLDRLAFRVVCSSGTYVRSLAHDLGQLLGCGGHLAMLRRTTIGPWDIADAVTAEALANRPEPLSERAWLDLAAVTLPFSDVTLNPTALAHFTHGQEIAIREADGDFVPGQPIGIRARNRILVGVGTVVAYSPRARTLNVAPHIVLAEVEAARQSC